MIFIQITSNNSGCVPSVGSWVEPTLSHVILQLMIISIVGAKHQVGVAPQNYRTVRHAQIKFTMRR